MKRETEKILRQAENRETPDCRIQIQKDRPDEEEGIAGKNIGGKQTCNAETKGNQKGSSGDAQERIPFLFIHLAA